MRDMPLLGPGLLVGLGVGFALAAALPAADADHLDHVSPDADSLYHNVDNTCSNMSCERVHIDAEADPDNRLDTAPAGPTGSPLYWGDRQVLTNGELLFASATRTSSLVIPSGGADVTVLSASLAVPDRCPGTDSHRFLAQATGYMHASEGGGTIARAALTLDSAAISDDESRRDVSLASLTVSDVASSKVFTGVGAGTHTFRLVMEASAPGYTLKTAVLTVQHLGWTC